MIGKLISFSYDYNLRKFVIQFCVNETGDNLQDMYDIFKDKELLIEVDEYSEKRSNEANRKYWKLVTQLANFKNQSAMRTHNELLRAVPVFETIDGQYIPLAIPDDDETYDKVLEDHSKHLFPTGIPIMMDGQLRRQYYLLKGSHEYTRKEFSKLLNYLIDECHDAGIPTMSEEEAERLISQWKVC